MTRPPPNTYQPPGCQQAETSRDACPVLRRSFRARRPPSSPTLVSSSGSRLLSLHQTPIGDHDRSVVAAPCPRNSSVPSPVQSNSSWLHVQLAPGSSKGQSSLEERPSAPHECAEGRWVSNQRQQMPGMVQEAIACFAMLAAITDLAISSRPHVRALPFVPVADGNRLQLDGWITHPRSFTDCVRESGPSRRLAPYSA